MLQLYQTGDLQSLVNGLNPPFLGSYYQDAAAIANVWNLIIVIGFAAPVTLFAVAIAETPTYQGNLVWLWSYTSTAALNVWTADLTATANLENAEVVWSMRLTNAIKGPLGCCTDFEWFRGVRNSLTGGYWQFYDQTKPTTPSETIRIDWAVTSAADLTLTFTNNSFVAATIPWGNGSYLEYAVSGDTLSFTAKNSTKVFPTVITYNSLTEAGSIRYDDGVSQGCWNAAEADVACP